jgi:ABC-type cobalt transport system, ATPase component
MQIQVKNLTHIYSEGTPYESAALSDVSFEVEKGEFVGIIGHTGSGKSTLIQHLNGLLKPKSGSILIDGLDITGKNVKMRDIRRRIGLVFQYPEYQLFEETVHKDVAFGPLNLGLAQEEADARVVEAIGLVGLDYSEIFDRSPFELSGGQRRRVAIAGVIAMKPEILILDEPTAGLDPKAHADILHMVETIHSAQQNSILLVSHNMGDIARLSDKILVMERGKLVLTGSPSEVFRQADLLESLGLGLPPSAGLMRELQNKGVPVSADILTVDAAEEELYRILTEQKNN